MFENYQQPAGYQFNGFGAPQAQPKVKNLLTAEEIKELMQTGTQFSLGLTQKEVLQSRCNHRSADGTTDTLVFDPNTGIARCTICGYEFKPIDAETSIDSIKDSVSSIIDILQTIKILYTDIPADAAAEYFQIIPLIGKIPALFEFAAKCFNKHEFNAWNYQNYNMGGMAMLQNLGNIFGSPVGFGAAQQPMMNPQQPVGYPQQPMMGNAFGYPGASQPMMGGYQPANPGFAYTPGAAPVAPAPAATPAPAAPAAPAADTTVTQTVTV